MVVQSVDSEGADALTLFYSITKPCCSGLHLYHICHASGRLWQNLPWLLKGQLLYSDVALILSNFHVIILENL